LGFYEKLVKSESLKTVCQNQCRSTESAHALLGLLLWDADRFGLQETTEEHVHERGEDSIGHEEVQEVLRRTSDPDATYWLKIRELVKSLTFDYVLEIHETRTPAVEQKRHHRKTLAEILDGFIDAYAEHTQARVQVDSNSPQQVSGRPEAGILSRDMFCALVNHLAKEAYRGEDHIWLTIMIIKDFAPGLLKDNHTNSMKEAAAFVHRLKAVRKKKGAIKEFNSLVALYKRGRSFPSIMKTFQPE